MLQPWQAYHALTYTKKWKPFIDEKWATYREEWTAEHPDEKLPKGRFQIMVEFMQDKYARETAEMKAECEEYRRNRRDGTPAAIGEEQTRNIEFKT